MTDFEMYSKETCEQAINSFQERLVEADNLMKDKNGMIDYETCWKAMRKEGPMILNVTKHLFTEYMKTYPEKTKGPDYNEGADFHPLDPDIGPDQLKDTPL